MRGCKPQSRVCFRSGAVVIVNFITFCSFFFDFFLKKSHENHVFLSLSLALFDSLLFFALSSLHKLNRRKSKSFSKSERSARHRARACFFRFLLHYYYFRLFSFFVFYDFLPFFFGFMSPIGFFREKITNNNVWMIQLFFLFCSQVD